MAYDRYSDDRYDRDRIQDRDRNRDRPRSGGFFRGGQDDRGPSRGDDFRRDERDRERERPRSGRNDDHRARKGIPYDETPDLIASSKVEGTPVYGRDDQRLGTVKALMIDKVEGQVRYAVLSHATGFLGLDEEVVPVSWEELRYDERRQGYRVDFTSDDVAYTLENRRRGRQEGRNLDRDAPRR
jgi:sporulation protein YlmC with PRC-barrel domain